MRLSREDSYVELNAYADSLAMIYRDWVSTANQRGVSQKGLVSRLQQAAEGALPAAFLRGKRLIQPESRMSSADISEVRAMLNENERTLATLLAPAVTGKLLRTRLKPGDSEFVITLEKAFTSRVRLNYGGVLWRTTQAGYFSGYKELKQAHAQSQIGVQMEKSHIVLERISQGDNSTCPECVGYAGIYEDDVPLPGEGVCQDSCRCFLEVRYILAAEMEAA